MHRTVLLLTLVMAFALPATAQPAGPGPQECAALRTLQLPGIALSEISAEWIPAGPLPANFGPSANTLPAYCRLQGTLNRRQGADGEQYGIGFALALPAAWNGRLLFQGGGGFNGVLAPPFGAGVAGDMSALARGFAVVSTDSGHRAPGGNPLDASFLSDQQASLDFAYQAVERVTAVAKAIVVRHYAQPVSRSYYVGCSTGGREAMLAAQRYPLEFDGVIDAARWADGNTTAALTDTATWTNLTTFVNRGGRMLFFHGVSDPTFSALDTIDYYKRLADANGGPDSVQRWSRLFLVPGMGHCGGGSLTTDSFDLLTALVDWVERNVPPDAVVAARRGEPRLTRPLCAYPKYEHYSGRGDPNDAASFSCRAP